MSVEGSKTYILPGFQVKTFSARGRVLSIGIPQAQAPLEELENEAALGHLTCRER